MAINSLISALIQYGLNKQLFQPCDSTFMTNRLLEIFRLDSYVPVDAPALPLDEILQGLVDYAVEQGLCEDDITSRDLFDTKVMGALVPFPREVRGQFDALYQQTPAAATDWFYQFSQDTNYIRTDRIRRDMRWKTETDYGTLDITINLSKPEKDLKSILLAKQAPASNYPKCPLCMENEGYAGRVNHPARQNHRIVPVTLCGCPWYLQYSPYVYYNEHCIVFSQDHAPMVINPNTLEKLLDFVTLFPHYFVGSNADLPVVGGSILSHEHFQGGRCSFPMERAPIEQRLRFDEYPDVQAGIVKWPLSVIRMTSPNREQLVALAAYVLQGWRAYSDESAYLFAQKDGEPLNTVTPIARRRGTEYELDLVLRNSITTQEHPSGVYHPHAELHHIKKENIGLIEVMGLAVLPARLKQELADLAHAILTDAPMVGDIEKHAPWAESLKARYTFTPENITYILKDEVGKVFAQCLEHAGVFKRTPEGQAAFKRFINAIHGHLAD